jgi:hypothetical protein
MKKPSKKSDELRKEYDLASLPDGVRGKYHQHPDVAKYFPTEQSVNSALRALIGVTKRPRSSR